MRLEALWLHVDVPRAQVDNVKHRLAFAIAIEPAQRRVDIEIFEIRTIMPADKEACPRGRAQNRLRAIAQNLKFGSDT